MMKRRFWALLLVLVLLPLGVMAEEAPVYINTLFTGGSHIEARFLNTKNNAKTDATVLLDYGEEELEVILIDGGLANGRCYQEVLEIRKALLDEAGLSDQYKNKNYKLRLTLMVTHCHKDHVAELYTNLLSSGMLEIKALYLPPATQMPVDGTYDDSANGDHMHRPRLLDAMARYAPDAPICCPDFGETIEVPLACGKATIYAPLQDYGTPEGLEYVRSVYYEGKTEAKMHDDVPVAVVNANSMWIRIELGESSMLFTGDIMKKKDGRTDEPFDNMIAAYGEALRSDIVKYPHHGISRNPAAEPLSKYLLEENGMVVLTTKGARDASGARLAALGTPFVTTEDGSYTFILDAAGWQQAK